MMMQAIDNIQSGYSGMNVKSLTRSYTAATPLLIIWLNKKRPRKIRTRKKVLHRGNCDRATYNNHLG